MLAYMISLMCQNNLLDPYINNLGLDENGMPKATTNEKGELVYDSGEYSDHSREVLGFTIDALKSAGPSGIRSFLGDHLNIPNEEIKALAEDVNYIDEEGQEFDDGAQARAFKDLNGYMEGRYTRQMRPHPDTIARNAQTSAAQIAAQKQVMLPGQEEIQAQQTEVMQTPQGTIAETVTEDTTVPNAAANMYEPQVEVQDTVEETVEETPIKMKSSSAKDLIKKYS